MQSEAYAADLPAQTMPEDVHACLMYCLFDVLRRLLISSWEMLTAFCACAGLLCTILLITAEVLLRRSNLR